MWRTLIKVNGEISPPSSDKNLNMLFELYAHAGFFFFLLKKKVTHDIFASVFSSSSAYFPFFAYYGEEEKACSSEYWPKLFHKA